MNVLGPLANSRLGRWRRTQPVNTSAQYSERKKKRTMSSRRLFPRVIVTQRQIHHGDALVQQPFSEISARAERHHRLVLRAVQRVQSLQQHALSPAQGSELIEKEKLVGHGDSRNSAFG